MTREQEIQSRLEAATPGPWGRSGTKLRFVDSKPDEKYGPRSIICQVWNDIDANADFLAHAPEDIAYLLSELARLTAANAERAARIAELEEERDAAVGDVDAILRNCECEIRHHYCARGYEVNGCDSDDCSDAVWRGPRREGAQG